MADRFAATFRREYAGVVRLARRLTGDAAEAEDVAQEVLERLADEPVLDRPDDEVRAWLWRVTTNTALNRTRGRRREHARLELVGRRAAVDAGADVPDEAALRRAEAAHVRDVLTGLAPRQQEVLVLRHSGCSYAEIAAATGLAPSSVGTVLARAERAFRAAFEEADRAHLS